MNEELVPQRKRVKYKHIMLGIIILLSGVVFGFIAGAYTVSTNFKYFLPKPGEVREHTIDRIITDYPELTPRREELNSILHNGFKEFGKLNEEISYKILQMQHDIAFNISELIDSKADKERWMKDFPGYFPGHKHRLRKARKFEERHKNMPDSCMLNDWDNPPPPSPPHK